MLSLNSTRLKLIKSASAAIALIFSTIIVAANASPFVPQVGDTYEITMTRQSAQHGSYGSSGSSNDKDTIVERVIGLRPNGLELEYDLPATTTTDERASNWQFPARIFKPTDGPAQLLNGAELNARVDNWLKAGGLSRAACGHWVFTWNAFRIECDPQSVIKAVEAYDLPADLRDGESYKDDEARTPGILTKKAGPDGDTIFTTEMPLDPDAIHRARAESDVVAGEILKRPVTLDVALRQREQEMVSGTISVTFETDSAGIVNSRTKLTTMNIKMPNGQSETDTITETLERRLVSRRD